MRQIFYFFLLLCLPAYAQSQEYSVQTCTYNLLTPSGSPTNLVLGDDVVSAPIDMGFNFPFYGEEYRRVYVSSNGFLSFENPQTSGCCAGQNLPTNFARTIIAFAWDDLYTDDGIVEYYTLGQTPNRVFVLEFGNVGYCCTNTNEVTAQIQLHESGEIRILSAVNNHTGRFSTMGIQDFERGFAAVDGRNGEDWSAAANECYSFTPPCAFLSTQQSAASLCAVDLRVDISRQPVAVAQNDGSVCIAEFSQAGLAQSFTAAGSLSCGAAIYIADNSVAAGSLTIELWDSLPNNPNAQMLATGTLPIVENGAWANVYWAQPVDIITGRRYHLVFTGSSPTQCVGGTVSSSYLGGNAHANNYASFNNFDYAFRIFDCAQYLWSNGATTATQRVAAGGTYNLSVDFGDACVLTGSERVTIELPEISITQASAGTVCAPQLALSAVVGDIPAIVQEENDGCMSLLDNPIAQSFTATSSQLCGAAILLEANGSGAGDLIFELRDSLPNAFSSGVLATGSLNGAMDGDWARVDFASSAVLTVGSRYYLVVSSSNAAHCAAGSSSVDRYAGGNAFAGGGFTSYPNFDYSFQLFGCPQYLWSTGSTSAVLNVSNSGNYALSVEIGGGCMLSETAQAAITPYPLTATATATNASCALCADGSAVATASGATGALTFLWSNGQTTSQATGLISGAYSVTITDGNGCTSSANTSVGIVSSLQENGSAQSIRLFPNPTSSGAFSLSGFVEEEAIDLRIYSIGGQLLQSESLHIQAGHTPRVETANLPAGVYVVEINSQEGQALARLRLLIN